MIVLYILLVWAGLSWVFAVTVWPHIAEHMELLNEDLEWVQNESVAVAPPSPEKD